MGYWTLFPAPGGISRIRDNHIMYIVLGKRENKKCLMFIECSFKLLLKPPYWGGGGYVPVLSIAPSICCTQQRLGKQAAQKVAGVEKEFKWGKKSHIAKDKKLESKNQKSLLDKRCEIF